MRVSQRPKINRNSLCPCGSQKKYKHCHLKIQGGTLPKVILRDNDYIEGMAKSCRLAKKTLDFIETKICPGVSTGELNDLIDRFVRDHHAIPATLNYKGYPKSSCISINDVICHGIPNNKEKLQNGDIVNIDVTTILDGYFGDNCRTYPVGECSEEAHKIMDVSKACLNFAIHNVKPYMRIGDIGYEILNCAKLNQCSVVEEFVGHSIGKNFHEDPQIPHYGKKDTGEMLIPGMFFTIEPMINLGAKELYIEEDGWTARTRDGSLSAQFEHTVMVTQSRLRPLTDENDDDPIFTD